MKKRNVSSFLSGVVVTLLIGCLVGSAVAKSGTQTAELAYRDIKVTLDGKSVALTDANGKAVEPFIIDGTTYLPVRAVATALGLNVGWDGSTSTVVLSTEEIPGQTSTPTQGTQGNEPIVFKGSGDDVLELKDLNYLYCFRISGNSSSDHFAVKTYDAKGNYSELLVNTTKPYSGVTFDASCEVRTIEVTASGAWTIEVVDLSTVDQATVGNTYSGSGDTLLRIPNHGKTATIVGNTGADHFAVIAYDSVGHYDDLLVNATSSYNGKVMLSDSAQFITVKAQGDWTFTLN